MPEPFDPLATEERLYVANWWMRVGRIDAATGRLVEWPSGGRTSARCSGRPRLTARRGPEPRSTVRQSCAVPVNTSPFRSHVSASGARPTTVRCPPWMHRR
jgi:hypothetical protein